MNDLLTILGIFAAVILTIAKGADALNRIYLLFIELLPMSKFKPERINQLVEIEESLRAGNIPSSIKMHCAFLPWIKDPTPEVIITLLQYENPRRVLSWLPLVESYIESDKLIRGFKAKDPVRLDRIFLFRAIPLFIISVILFECAAFDIVMLHFFPRQTSTKLMVVFALCMLWVIIRYRYVVIATLLGNPFQYPRKHQDLAPDMALIERFHVDQSAFASPPRHVTYRSVLTEWWRERRNKNQKG